MHIGHLKDFVDKTWDESVIPALMEYVHIPNKSPMFDSNWHSNGHMDKAIKLAVTWCRAQNITGLTIDVIRLDNRTPLLYIEIEGHSDETILMYGHLDKQPEMTGWDADLAPWKPVLRDNKLYGRGAADDGYAIFASITAIKALQVQHVKHARCVIIIETCEESGSYDLPFYMDALATRIGNPDLVICLDSGCGNYEQLWMTTSLRGLVGGTLTIKVLREGIHSGIGSGTVPSGMLILRQLLSRLEHTQDGHIKLTELKVKIPKQRLEQAKQAADILGPSFLSALPLVEKAKPLHHDNAELLLNRTWRAALSVTGMNGIPSLKDAGNVTLPHLSVKLSMRLPPTCSADEAAVVIKRCLEAEPPFGVEVQFAIEDTASGWNAPAEADWLTDAAEEVSQTFFNKPAAYIGEGGTIPFMGMLGKRFPEAQFLITGVLGPGANAHGPNEFLHIPMGKALTCCVAGVVVAHFKR